jgi:hypothetical protein
MTTLSFPYLHFDIPFDARAAFEAEARGYWGHCTVELADGSMHPVAFYDAIRLGQDLDEECRQGRPFLAEKGLIVLQEVTKENMERAVTALAKEGFFK